MRDNRTELLYGAIRRDLGRGLVFYDALKAATAEELRSALAPLESKRACYRYPYYHQRRLAIRRRLEKMQAAGEGS